MRRSILCLGAFALFTGGAVQTNAGIVYDQPSNNFGFFYSQHDTSGGSANATTYDNFTLGASSTVVNVGWVGGFLENVVHNDITSFTLTFYNDASGQPGSSFATETISGNAGEAFVGQDAFKDFVYNYNANLPTPLNLTGGTQYWLSVVGNLNTGGTFQWGWENSSGGDGAGFQILNGGTPVPINSDSAFTLSDTAASTPIPEPSTIVLSSIVFGIFGAVWSYKRLKLTTAA